MAEIFLTPAGHLNWQSLQEDSASLKNIGDIFSRDWREGLFCIAAEKMEYGNNEALEFWGRWAQRYLVQLCHIPDSQGDFNIELPSSADLAETILSAPPMRGGEYLTQDVLSEIWAALNEWGKNEISLAGGLSQFLTVKAPKWRQVGRVCFHLAENKADAERPFAFMATFSTGFGTGGKLKHLPLRSALEHYAGTKNRPALVKLLEPIQAASQRCGWLAEMVTNQSIFSPATWPSELAYKLLRDVPVMEEAGLVVRLPNWWKQRPKPTVSVTIGNNRAGKLGAEALLDFNVAVAVGDEVLSPQEIEELLAGSDGLVSVRGQWVEVDREKLVQVLEHWKKVQRQAADGGISFIEGMRLLAGASANLQPDEKEEDRTWANVSAGNALREILDGLRQPDLLSPVHTGRYLNAELRPYQQHGLAWMNFITTMGLGACLADDMGLGKTIQVLALLLCRKHSAVGHVGTNVPSLLVVPASLLGNWRAEAEKFAPSLNLLFLHPAETPADKLARIAAEPARHIGCADLVITTYSMMMRQNYLAEYQWSLVILDEAQAIKNPSTHQTKAVKKIPAHARIVMTGTPIENRLGDLWSLFDFLNPGLLGSAAVFKQFVKSLESREQNKYEPLRKLAGPYILRRLKTDRNIISDLPEKTETNCYCGLTKTQLKLYVNAVQTLENTLKMVSGMARRGVVLQTMMQLKQICNHPSQFSGDGDYSIAASGKFQRLAMLCEELASRQDKVLVFTQFREITDALEEILAGVFGRRGLVLHGGTGVKKRNGLVEQFQAEAGPPFFILSLKAGGTGLNLTAASHIIHFDRWWNPAVENQATDRAFRIGQKKNVQVHKFVTTGTLEERIDKMLSEKQQMADEILSGGGELNVTELSDDEIISLVKLDVTRAGI